MSKFVISLLILLFLCSPIFSQRQIDTFNILFPQIQSQKSNHPIQLITADGGCFQFSSSQVSIIKILPLSLPSDNKQCYKRGLIQLTHIGKYSASIYISTTNSQTQQLTNIPVRIKPMNKIEIIAKSRIMNRGERQDLSVYAYDQDLNKFTSLEGLRFKWEITNGNNITKDIIVTKISLANSHLIMQLDQRKNIQKKGAESDIIVIKGENPGKTLVKVTCIQPGYQHLKHQIYISVTQRFDIHPAIPTYLLTGSKFDFKLITPTREQISLPQKHYKSIVNKQFKVSPTLQMTTPQTESQTFLKVQDTRTSPSYSSQVQVFAKKADKLILKAQQYLIVGQKSKIQTQFYWQNHLLKGTSQKIQISTSFNYDPKTKMIFAQQKKTDTIKARYQHLTAQKKVHTVLPLKAILPSDQIILPLEEMFELKIIGGSGVYEYEIKDDTYATISGNGVISTRKQGRTLIKVFDKKTQNNRIILNLIVLPLAHLVPLENQKELNKNQYGSVFTIGMTKNHRYYTKCSEQPILLEIGHTAQFQQSKNSSFSDSMKILKKKITQNQFIAQNLKQLSLLKMPIKSFTDKFSMYIKAGDITVEQIRKYAEQLQNYGICSARSIKSYQKYDGPVDVFFEKSNNVKNKFQLRVYQPITNAIEGKQNQNRFIMTPLSSLNWKTNGGSYKWEQQTRVFLNNTESINKYPKIQCPGQQITFQTTITYINKQSNHLLFPISQKKTISIECTYPTQLKIKYEKYNANQYIIKALEGQVIKGQLIPFTSKKQTFYNSSNILYSFQKTHGNLQMTNNKFKFDPQIIQKHTKVTFWTQFIQPSKLKFQKVSTYFEYQTKKLFTIKHYPITKHMIMLYNPKSSYYLPVSQISENQQFMCNGSVLCGYLEQNKNKLISINTSRYGQGYLSLKDKNMYGAPGLEIFFQVVDADSINLKIENTSLQIQKQTIAQVQLSYKHKVIPTWQYQQKYLSLSHQSGIRSQFILNSFNKFLIKTSKPGYYPIMAQKQFPTHLQSKSISLTVYQPISLNIQTLPSTYINNILHYDGQIMLAVDCYRIVNIFNGPHDVKADVKIIGDDNNVVYVGKISQNTERDYKIQGKSKGKTKIVFTVIEYKSNNNKVAIIDLTVVVKLIDNVAIYTLDEAIINAQFRVIPHLIIDQMVLLDSVCDLQYQWKTNNNINIKSINNKAGVNATAIKQGDGLIQLKVSNTKGQTVLTSKKNIKVHKSLDLQLPTIIGQSTLRQISTNLLLPPNSGYSFDSNIHLTKISSCDDGTLMIKQNQLITSRQKSVISIQIQKHNDETYNNFLNVIITDIKALFIQNQYSLISGDLGQVKKVKFYIQDKYGRLFYNNLHNIQFSTISSNQQIFTATLDSSKQFINIYPKKHGKAQLLLKLKSSSSHTNKLLQIPHDIVYVEIGKVIQPQSPIILVKGGYVDIQIHGKAIREKWEVLKGEDNVQLNTNIKRIIGKKIGQTEISIAGYNTIIKVVDVKLKYKWIENANPGFTRAVAEFILNENLQGSNSIIHSIQNTYNYVNNNMKLTCQPTRKTWFSITSHIQKDPQGFDKLICIFTLNNKFDIKDQLPIKLQWSIINRKSSKIQILQTFSTPIHPTFFIQQQYKTNIISFSTPYINIPIKSLIPLKTQIINGQKQWIKQWVSDVNQVQILHVQVDPRGMKKGFEFQIKLENQQTGQTQIIKVKFVMDQKQREKQQNKQDKQNRKQQKNGFFSAWHWTDFLILLMALNLIAIMIYQNCTSNNQNKYKQL